jgi:hypothetical protein
MSDPPEIHSMNKSKVTSILAETGPLTGAQLVERSGMEVLLLWRHCRNTPQIQLKTAGRRFLRLDRNVDGYARLSPSIRREFLTYTFAGLDGQEKALEAEVGALDCEIRRISRFKLEIAGASIDAALAILPDRETVMDKACFIIAGDVVYDMSHTVPRPERSTGEMVQGSDLDIVAVFEDDLDPEIVHSLDNAIHKKKHLLLVNDREEIDYLIKSISRVREQLKFDIFSSMVACKILNEGRFLYGNKAVFQKMKSLIDEFRIPERLNALEQEAVSRRESAETQLQAGCTDSNRAECYNLFYTHAEEDEIY